MKRYLVCTIVLAVVLLLVAGCAQQPAPEPVKKTEPTKTIESEPKTTVTEPEPMPEKETAPEPAKQMSKKMQELLQKHVGRVKSIKYMYQDQTNKPEEWETWIKGNKMHVKLREMDNIREDVYIDNVYIDLGTKSAKGYCERNVYRCADPNSPIEVNYAKYYRKTPLEWLAGITYAEKVAEEQMQSRTVWKIQYEEDGATITMWVDDYYGVPVKIEERKGSAVNDYIFEDISFNSVDDADLEHAFIESSYK